MTYPSYSALSRDIGASVSTVVRAAQRLGIATPISSAEARALRRAITPGGRGHWPRGKRRNTPSADWPEIRQRLADMLSIVRSSRGISRAALADKLGVGPTQITRWLRGTHVPDARTCEKIREWIDSHVKSRSAHPPEPTPPKKQGKK